MAYYDKAVSPGGEGKITLNVRTKGYQGKIHKNARVVSNDPRGRSMQLEMKAFVKVAVAVSSPYIYLYGEEGQEVSRTVEIQAKLDKPLEIMPVAFNLSEKMTYSVEETEKNRRFQIKLKNLPGTYGMVNGFLKLKTNYSQKPELIIWIRGRFRKKEFKPATPKPKG